MKKILLFALLIFFIGQISIVQAGFTPLGEYDTTETDTTQDTLIFFFDLRERETYIQLTNTDFAFVDNSFTPGGNITIHIQIFDVSNNCNENNFFDAYTPADTHIYNMRDIQTNDGNPSGVVLPDGAYGFVFALVINDLGEIFDDADILIGNLRILDSNGFEYRTNAQTENDAEDMSGNTERYLSFNFNTLGNVTFSEIIGVAFEDFTFDGEVKIADILDSSGFDVVNIDLFDSNENLFSCRDVIFSCVNENSSLLEELLEEASENSEGSASVASAEYGINDAIPHSKGGELLCPGNNISEGFIRIESLKSNENPDDFVAFLGLNNGNGRGSMDAVFIESQFVTDPMQDG